MWVNNNNAAANLPNILLLGGPSCCLWRRHVTARHVIPFPADHSRPGRQLSVNLLVSQRSVGSVRTLDGRADPDFVPNGSQGILPRRESSSRKRAPTGKWRLHSRQQQKGGGGGGKIRGRGGPGERSKLRPGEMSCSLYYQHILSLEQRGVSCTESRDDWVQ